ncbi:MAG: helix-turn-helix domain-containing protein [Archaeoglobaceae archaeon]
MTEVSKGRILLAIKNGKNFFNEIELETKASPTLINRTLAELEREGLIFVELDRSTGRRRPRYKLNESRMDEINKLINAYLEHEKKELKEKMERAMHYIEFTEEEKKEIAELVEKLKKKLGV